MVHFSDQSTEPSGFTTENLLLVDNYQPLKMRVNKLLAFQVCAQRCAS